MESELSTTTLPENIPPALAEKLKLLAPGTYILHRSWGFGRIKDWDGAHESLTIDFKTKPGHGMQFAYAAESLTPLAPEHLLVQKVESPDVLRDKIRKTPVSVVQDAIRSLGPQATADNIQALLSPDVIPSPEYKKWWEGAKRALKKDGHFYVPTRKNEVVAPARCSQRPRRFRAGKPAPRQRPEGGSRCACQRFQILERDQKRGRPSTKSPS